VVFFVFAAAGTGPRTADAAVTAAVIDFDRTTVGAALEAELLANADIRWVERNRLDLVTGENRLQAAFAAEGGAVRLELGKLLAADALVLVRRRVEATPKSEIKWKVQQVDAPDGAGGGTPRGTTSRSTLPTGPASGRLTPHGAAPHGTAPRSTAPGVPRGKAIFVPANPTRDLGYEIVVCETKRGLRTMTLRIAETKERPLDVKRLASVVLARVSRAGDEIRAVYTVPPLAARDLTYANNSLQRAYAEVLIQRLLELPGAAVVETAEARALAAERIVAGAPAGKADFVTPIFINGEFRHSGAGVEGRVRIQASARQGESAVGEPLDRELRPEEVAAALTAWVDRLAGGTAGAADIRPVDPDAEAARLLERAKDFLAWDNWEEASSLAEAGLLFAPRDLPLHRLAFDAAGRAYTHYSRQCLTRQEAWPPLRIAFHRKCDHLEFLARHDALLRLPMNASGTLGIATYFGVLRGVPPPRWPEAREILDELARREAEVLLRVFRIYVERGFHFDAQLYLRLYLTPLPAEQKHAEIIRSILEYPPDKVAEVAHHIVHGQFQVVGVDLNPKLAILRELKSHTERPDLVAIAEREERSTLERQADEAKTALNRATKPWSELSPAGAPYRQVRFQIRRPAADGKPETLESTEDFIYSIRFAPMGPKLDVATSHDEMYLVREPGILDPLLKTPQGTSFASDGDLEFDGRYVWTSISDRMGRRVRLFVVDPNTGRSWISSENFGYADGPDSEANRVASLRMVSLGSGEMFAVTRRGRTNVIRLKFDPQAAEPFTLTTVLECPERAGQADTEAWRNPQTIFFPGYLKVLTPAAGGSPPRHVLIGRSGAWGDVDRHPLLVDLATHQVEILDLGVEPTGGVDLADEKIYFTHRSRRTIDPLRFYAFDLRTRTSTLLDGDSPNGNVVIRGDTTYVLGAHWWKKGPQDDKFHRVTPVVPWTMADGTLAYGSKFDVRHDENPPLQLYRLVTTFESAHHGLLLWLTGNRSRFTYLALDLPPASEEK
jgi:hypothetical protein